MSEICKARRGQVWFIVNPNAPVEFQGSVQGKNRPWLIVSNDKCNEHSPTFSAVPVTTAAKKPLPVHVQFNDGKLDQIILCEQQQTFPVSLLTTQGSYYKYSLSTDLMQRVNEALAIQNGINLQIPNAERFWHSIEQLIKVRVKDALACAKVDTIDVGKLSALIDTKVADMVADTIKADNSSLNANTEDNVNKHAAPAKEEPTEDVKPAAPSTATADKPKATKTRNKWTTDAIKEFLNDFDKYSTELMLKKYNMSLKTLYVTRSKFKKQLCL
jgi:mRNA interferase MazF